MPIILTIKGTNVYVVRPAWTLKADGDKLYFMGDFKMKKSIVTSFAMLSLGLLLAGCGNSASDKSDNAGKEAKTTQGGKSSSNKKDEREITNGPLLKVGQWTKDDEEGKTTLLKIAAPKNTTVKDGPIIYTIKDIKLLKVETTNKNQREYANDVYQSNGVTNPYYHIQIQFNAKNTSNEEVQLNGIKSIVLNTGDQVSLSSGLNDDSLGSSIAANANEDHAAFLLVKTGKQKQINKLTVNFDSVSNAETSEDIGTADSLEIPFK